MKKSKFLLLGILGLAGTLPVMGESAGKLDAGSRARLRALNSGIEISTPGPDRRATVRRVAPDATAKPLQAFIKVTDEAAAVADLESAGCTITGGRGSLLLVEFPQEALAAVEALDCVKNVRLSRPVAQKLDLARQSIGVDKIHSGLELPRAYTGKNVVAGIVDGGFDPNHINFQNPDGSSRIQKFTYFRPTQSGGYVEDTRYAEYIPNIDTEDSDTYHGTHTLGIMAGSYRGPVSAAVKKSMFAGEVREMDNPYYGIAYDADISVACGALSDYYIAMGVESILDYAYMKAPAVVNLSLGSNVGPHDGTSTICQYLDLVSQNDDVVICVSAGNEGDLPIALHKTLTEDDLSVRSCLYPAVQMTSYQNVRYGTTYVYSDSPEQFEIQALIINKSRGVAAMRMPLPPTDGASKYWASSSDYAQSGDEVSAQLARYVEGYIGVGAEFDSESGRYYAVLDYMCWDNKSTNPNGNYIVGFEITGKAGQRIDVFCDGVYNNLDSYGLNGYMSGSGDGSISDVATGHNYVVVGSYNTRDEWASLDGGVYGYRGDFPVGKITGFTSYGTLVDGRSLPTVCAPGAAIISSSNEYYLQDNASQSQWKIINQAELQGESRHYSWHQSVGTSMASPVVAGSIALWLEANPELRYEEVLDIIRTTALRDEDVESAPNQVQWGAGKFDAYAGLKEVLRRQESGVGSVSVAGQEALCISATGERLLSATIDGATDFTARLYNTSGLLCGSYRSSDGRIAVDAASLPAGVYILSAQAKGRNFNERIIVK